MTIRLTAAQAAVRYLAAQRVDTDAGPIPYFAGVWAIFGHGNVAGLGEALYQARDDLPTFRAHNEQGMAHAAIAFAKQMRRRRAMICTSSIGPGATNMVTAAALAHVNRLPVLFLPGDIYASRRPDPVLQQVEDFGDGTLSANDCFRPVSRYFDRISRPEQLLAALPRAMATLFDPADCGPVTLSFCQDVQAEAWDYPDAFFRPMVRKMRAPRPDAAEIAAAAALIRAARRPLLIVGGGVAYAGAEAALVAFAEAAGVPFAETQAGKGVVAADHPLNLGAIGVTGTSAANDIARAADLVIGVGTRLQDFTTGSRALFSGSGQRLIQVNVAAFDAEKHGALAVVGDAAKALTDLTDACRGWRADAAWATSASALRGEWGQARAAVIAAPTAEGLPSDAQVIGALARKAPADAVVVCAAGGLPGELHKLWETRTAGGYHVEYGYSCMGYEIAGGLGVKMAAPDRNIFVLVGDGSYLMLNSELATAVMLGQKITVLLLDNRGFGCINRLQQGTGGAPFNNLLADSSHAALPLIDFAAHAASLGAVSEKVSSIAALEDAFDRAAAQPGCAVIVIDTDPAISTEAGGAWWDVAVPEISGRAEVMAARRDYDAQLLAHKNQDDAS